MKERVVGEEITFSANQSIPSL